MPLAAFALMWMLAACEARMPETETGTGTETEGLVFKLSAPPALTVNATRADDTKPLTLAGIEIKEVWVVQFDTDDKMLKAQNFAQNKMKSIQDKESFLIEVATDGFSNVNSHFRVIANAGTGFLTDFATGSEEKKLLQKTVALTTIQSERSKETGLLISDALEYTKVETTPQAEDGVHAVIMAPLNRAYAEMKVKWTDKLPNDGSSITITSIDACNLPKNIALGTCAGDEKAVIYPAADAGNFDATYNLVSSSTETGIAAGTEKTFYMPENLRGRGCATSFYEKNLKDYGPTALGTPPTLGTDGKPTGGSLANCTYIELTGEYKYAEAHAGAITVKYRIYPGTNLIDDYNIRRGYSYTLDVQISGANSGDVRVTITDGGVVVFDEIDHINMTVDF